MKVFAKTLRGTNFEIKVNPEDTIAQVKGNIENVQGSSVYPADQQVLVYQGKILQNETTLNENQVSENSFLVVLLSKVLADMISQTTASSFNGTIITEYSMPPYPYSIARHMYSMPPYLYLAVDYGTQLSLFTRHMWFSGFLIAGAAAHAAVFMVKNVSAGPSTTATMTTSNVSPAPSAALANPPTPIPTPTPTPIPTAMPAPTPTPTPTAMPTTAPAPAVSQAAALTSVSTTEPSTTAPPVSAVAAPIEADVYGQAASNLVAGNNLEQTVQQILDMGGGTWDRDTVIRALRAAFNNPERAVEYLYSGIPEQVQAPPVARAPVSGQPNNPPTQAPALAQPAVPSTGSTGPNTNPLDLFPQGIPSLGSNASAGGLDVLRNSPQFRTLQAMVQANPQILQPMLQELAKQNPQIMRLIQEHQGEFLRLINEPAEGAESNLLSQLTGGVPQQVTVTQEESEAIERLEAMGFDRALVLEVFFACNRNEELAANYLLDHMNEFDE